MAHSYIKVGRHYFAAEQSLVSAIRLLVFAHGRLNLQSLDLRRKNMLRVLGALLARRLHLRRFDTMSLPVFGHVCRRVHGGHKIFNLAEGTVTKVFAPDTPPECVSSELKGALAKDPLRFAPTIVAHDLEHRWYTETYVAGVHGRVYYGADLAHFQHRFERDIASCLEKILMLRPPCRTELHPYALEAVLQVKQQLSLHEVPTEVARVILRFVDHVREDLQAAPAQEVWLGFTHGDFAMTNVLRTKDQVAVIDWESAGQRSIAFDLYSYFFGEVYYGRAQPQCSAAIGRAMQALNDRLEGRLRDAPQLTALEPIYRKLFYLERLRMIAERRIQGKLFASIALRFIEVFSGFEAELEDGARYRRILSDLRLIMRSSAPHPAVPPPPRQWLGRTVRALRLGALCLALVPLETEASLLLFWLGGSP